MAENGIEIAMTPMTGEKGVMGYHAEMMAQVLMKLGCIEEKLNGMIEEDKTEDAGETETESEGPALATNPVIW